MFIFISASALVYLNEYSTGSTMYYIYYASCCLADIFTNFYIKRHSASIQKLSNIYYNVYAVAISSVVIVIFNYFNINNAFLYTAAMFVLCGAVVAFSLTIVYSFSLD